MGYYANVPDVELYTPARVPYGPNTKPSASAVAGLLAFAEVEADSILTKAGYGTPIPTTATLACARVRMAVAQMTAAYVEDVAPTSGPDSRRSHYERMADAARRMLSTTELIGVEKDGRKDPRFSTATAFFTRDMEL